MGLKTVWESFKIDKVASVRKNRIALLLLFIFASILFITEPIEATGTDFYNGLYAFAFEGARFPVPSTAMLITIVKSLVLKAVGLYFMLYSTINYLEYRPENRKNKLKLRNGEEISLNLNLPDKLQSLSVERVAFKYFPYFLLLGLAMLSLRIFSVFLFNIPFYILATMLSMTMLELIYEERDLFQAMEASSALTYGFKFYIFFQFLALSLAFSIMENLLLRLLASSWWAGSLIRAILLAWKTFAYGRLAGINYKITRFLHTSIHIFQMGQL